MESHCRCTLGNFEEDNPLFNTSLFVVDVSVDCPIVDPIVNLSHCGCNFGDSKIDDPLNKILF